MPRGPFHGIRRFLTPATRRAAQVQRDVEDEVAFHLDMKTQELIEAGHTPDDARRKARDSFGNVERATRALQAGETRFEHRRRRARWFGEWGRDTFHAIRQMQQRPAFAALVVGTLALGIGATTAIFSAVHAILLAPLPYDEPERLVRVLRHTPSEVVQSSSGGDYLEFQRTTTTLSALTSYYASTGNLAGAGTPRRVITARVSANFFDVLGVRPMLGRTFTPEEDVFRAAEVALVSHGAWQRLFGGDPDVWGRPCV